MSKAQSTSTWKTFKVLLHFFPVLDVSFTRYRGFFNTIKVLLLRLNCCSSFGSMVVFIGKEINSVNNQILLTVSFFDQELDLNTSPANSYTRERVCAILWKSITHGSYTLKSWNISNYTQTSQLYFLLRTFFSMTYSVLVTGC